MIVFPCSSTLNSKECACSRFEESAVIILFPDITAMYLEQSLFWAWRAALSEGENSGSAGPTPNPKPHA